jgi:hypothetical protein
MVDVLMCRCFDVSMFWCVDVLMCRCFDVSMFWCVDVLMCRCFDVFCNMDSSACQHFGRSTTWKSTKWRYSKSRHFDGRHFGILQLGSRHRKVTPLEEREIMIRGFQTLEVNFSRGGQMVRARGRAGTRIVRWYMGKFWRILEWAWLV